MAEEITLKDHMLTNFLIIVEDWRKRWKNTDNAIFRGQTDFNWILIAKLFRDPNTKSENKIGDNPKDIESQLLKEHLPSSKAHDIEKELFHNFSNYLYAYRPDLISSITDENTDVLKAMQEWRQLALAQHYGLPTRFLDFTSNVLVALYFAVDGEASKRKLMNGDSKEQDSAVWCINTTIRKKVWEVLEKDGTWLSPLNFAKEGSSPPIKNFVDTAFVPEHIDGRVRAQGSIFMCEPRGKKESWTLHEKLKDKTDIDVNGDSKQSSLKICIPYEMRESLLNQLDLIGINKANLFPDLSSAADYLKWKIYQQKSI